jgi:hypothetical protein
VGATRKKKIIIPRYLQDTLEAFQYIAGFLLYLLSSPEDGSVIFLQNIG